MKITELDKQNILRLHEKYRKIQINEQIFNFKRKKNVNAPTSETPQQPEPDAEVVPTDKSNTPTSETPQQPEPDAEVVPTDKSNTDNSSDLSSPSPEVDTQKKDDNNVVTQRWQTASCEGKRRSCYVKVLQVQMKINDNCPNYAKTKLAEDGIWGPNTSTAFDACKSVTLGQQKIDEPKGEPKQVHTYNEVVDG
jgi:hypothetical protein